MSYTVEWHGDEAQRKVRAQTMRFLERAAITVKNRAKELLSVAGTGKVKGKQVGPIIRSQPGEPPRKQTGLLRMRVAHEVDEGSLSARVGTNVEYGKHLELGTGRVRPRPWLRRSLAEMTAKVGQLLNGLGEIT